MSSSTPKKNSNCLQGLECPKCKSQAPLVIAVQTSFRFTDNGEDDRVSDLEWDDKSYCECCKCGFNAKVGDFKIKDDGVCAGCGYPEGCCTCPHVGTCLVCEKPVAECKCDKSTINGGN